MIASLLLGLRTNSETYFHVALQNDHMVGPLIAKLRKLSGDGDYEKRHIVQCCIRCLVAEESSEVILTDLMRGAALELSETPPPPPPVSTFEDTTVEGCDEPTIENEAEEVATAPAVEAAAEITCAEAQAQQEQAAQPQRKPRGGRWRAKNRNSYKAREAGRDQASQAVL